MYMTHPAAGLCSYDLCFRSIMHCPYHLLWWLRVDMCVSMGRGNLLVIQHVVRIAAVAGWLLPNYSESAWLLWALAPVIKVNTCQLWQ